MSAPKLTNTIAWDGRSSVAYLTDDSPIVAFMKSEGYCLRRHDGYLCVDKLTVVAVLARMQRKQQQDFGGDPSDSQ